MCVPWSLDWQSLGLTWFVSPYCRPLSFLRPRARRPAHLLLLLLLHHPGNPFVKTFITAHWCALTPCSSHTCCTIFSFFFFTLIFGLYLLSSFRRTVCGASAMATGFTLARRLNATTSTTPPSKEGDELTEAPGNLRASAHAWEGGWLLHRRGGADFWISWSARTWGWWWSLESRSRGFSGEIFGGKF